MATLYSVPVQNGSKVEWERKSATEMTPSELLYKYSEILIELHKAYDCIPCNRSDNLKELENELLSRCK